jgi:hypothetical protein
MKNVGIRMKNVGIRMQASVSTIAKSSNKSPLAITLEIVFDNSL